MTPPRSTARDLDIIRGVLGEERRNFPGYAYGTYLGATYGSLFPGHLDRTVHDSAVNPDWLWRQQFMSQAVAFRRNIDEWAAWAGGRPGRFGLGAGQAAVLARVEETAAKLAASPVHGVSRTVFDGAMGPGATYRPLWPHLADLVRELGQGSGTAGSASAAQGAAALAAVAAGGFTPPEGPLRPGVIDAVTCEKDWPTDLDVYYRDMRVFRDRYPYGYGVMRAGPWDCTFRSFTHPEPVAGLRRDGYPPGIVVHAECDTTTPFEGGRVMAGQLGAHLISLPDEGFHEIYGMRGSTAVDDCVTAYLVDGTLPPATTTVRGTPRPDIPPGAAAPPADAAGKPDLAAGIRAYIDRHHLM